MLRSAVVIGLAALVDIVEGSNHDLPFGLDANGCVVDYQPNVDYYPPVRRAMMEGAGISHPTATKADDFSITYHKTYKVVRNLPTGLSYILHHCGTPSVFADLPADAAGSPVFVVPVKKWSSGLTTTYTFLEELDLTPHAVFLDNRYMSSACGQKLVACGVIATPPAVSWPAVINWTAEVEKSVSEVHFTDKFGDGTAATGLSIEVAFEASSDPGLLSRAEWLKFAAAFFNKEPEANRVFEDIRSRFEAIVEKVAAVEKGSASVAGGVVAPKVLFLTKYSWEAFTRVNTAHGRLDSVKAAGGVTPAAADLAAHCTANAATNHLSAADITLGYANYFACTDAGLKVVLMGIDVVVDEYLGLADYALSDFMTTYNFSSAMSATDYPFMSAKVLRTDRLMAPETFESWGSLYQGSAWGEDGFVKPDVMLSDLASYLHPTLAPSLNKPHYFRNIAAGETVTLATAAGCDDPYATCPGDQVPAAIPPIYNVCDNLFCIPTSLLAMQADNAQMQATIAQLQADNAQVDKLLAEKAQCAVDKSLNAAEVLAGLKDKTIKVVFN